MSADNGGTPLWRRQLRGEAMSACAALVFTLDRKTNAIVSVDIHSSPANLCTGDHYHFTPGTWHLQESTYEAAVEALSELVARHASFFAEPGTPLHEAIMAVTRGESGEVKS